MSAWDEVKTLATNYVAGVFNLEPIEQAILFYTLSNADREWFWWYPPDELGDADYDDMQAAVSNTRGALMMPVLPIGFMMWYPLLPSTPRPPGWVPCSGGALSRTTFAKLFDVIGTTHGVGDGSTTYNVPNMNDRIAAGWGSGLGTDVATQQGALTHTLTVGQIPAHTHVYQTPLPTAVPIGAGVPAPVAGTGTFAANTGGAGNNEAHNNVQPTMVGTWYIYAGA